MNLPPNKIEINCPTCRYTFYTNKTYQTDCPQCKTIIDLDKDGKIVGDKVPAYHETAIPILVIASFIISMVIIIDAVLSKNAVDKLTALFVIFIMAPIAYFWLPIRLGYSRKYMGFSFMISLTFILLSLLILNLGNFLLYK